MAKKKTGLSSTLFADINPYGKEASQGNELVVLTLTAVRPDPNQPRQLLPAPLAQQLNSGLLTPQEALQQWLAQGSNPRLTELRKLADSIAQHGLISPITVRPPDLDETVPAGVTHLVVTGERRYWAHVLLDLESRTIQQGEQTHPPTQLRTLVAASGVSIRAHQMIENIMREDINAVEKAQGLWALRYELSGVNRGSQSGQGVNRGSQKLVPWDAVEKTLSISRRYRIYLTNVLTLPDAGQAIVAQHNLAERTIRPIVQKLKGQPELQLAALQQIGAWEESDEDIQAVTKAVEELVARLLRQVSNEAQPKTLEIKLSTETKRLSDNVRKTLRMLHRMRDEEVAIMARDLALDDNYGDAVDNLRSLREQLDYLIAQVDGFQQAE